MLKRIEVRYEKHRKATINAKRLANKYLMKGDFNEAARWADAAKSHRFVCEVLGEIISAR